MKKNVLKISAMMFAAMLMMGITIASAANYTSIVSITTPARGGIVQNKNIYDGKETNSGTGTVYTTYQATALAHSISLTYLNSNGTKWVQGSDWATAQVDSIKRPNLWLTTYGIPFFSQAKSHNLEPTNNTVVKFRFSADRM